MMSLKQKIIDKLDGKFRDWLSTNRWINSDESIGAWKRDEIKNGLLQIVEKNVVALLSEWSKQIQEDDEKYVTHYLRSLLHEHIVNLDFHSARESEKGAIWKWNTPVMNEFLAFGKLVRKQTLKEVLGGDATK
jgi:predicted NAD/FAD-dependent oxidoreductase